MSTTAIMNPRSAVSRQAGSLVAVTLTWISDILKICGKWEAALKLSKLALKQSRGLGCLTEGMALLSVGHSLHWLEDLDAAVAHLSKAKTLIEKLSPSRDQTCLLIQAVILLGDTLVQRGRPEDLTEVEALAGLSERLLQSSTGSPFWMDSMLELGEIYYGARLWAKGETLLRKVVPILVQKRGERHATTIAAHRDLAIMLVHQDKYEEAEEALRVTREWNDRMPVLCDKDKAAINFYIAWCLFQKKDRNAAMEELGKMDLSADLLHNVNGHWKLESACLPLRIEGYDEEILEKVLDEHANHAPTSQYLLALNEDQKWEGLIAIHAEGHFIYLGRRLRPIPGGSSV